MPGVGPIRRATKRRVATIEAADPALVALAYCLADLLDDPDTVTASAAREYRATITQLTGPGGAKKPSVYDLDDDPDGS